ncbi:hypothetical protein LCGC14_1315640 [marine sediment metagenome]|uniref:Uncharacterized protein n=1 Tax=marine sediment metagenome TaxID=412755 RepID=A0A0F9NNF3_9ZZZZ
MYIYHYSNINIKNKIEPEFFSANLYSKNDKNISNLARSFFFTSEYIPEYRFKNCQYKYIISINKARLYDLKIDKYNYKKKYKNISDLLRFLKNKYNGVIYNLGYEVVNLFIPIKYISKTIKGV